MFHLDAMNKIGANVHKSATVVTTPNKVHTVFNGTAFYTFFAVRMKTTGAISIRIWNLAI